MFNDVKNHKPKFPNIPIMMSYFLSLFVVTCGSVLLYGGLYNLIYDVEKFKAAVLIKNVESIFLYFVIGFLAIVAWSIINTLIDEVFNKPKI